MWLDVTLDNAHWHSLYQASSYEPYLEIIRRIESNPAKYAIHPKSSVQMMLTEGTPAVVISDYTALRRNAQQSGQCNWAMLEQTYLPLGFGVAFQQGSPFKTFIDNT